MLAQITLRIKHTGRPSATVKFYAADGKTAGLRVVELWIDVAIEEVQATSDRRRGSAYRPEVAARALVYCRTRGLTDVASIRKREWELSVI